MDEPLLKRIMPHSTVAEQSVISSMLMDKDAIGIASDMLTKDDFYTGQYGIMFQAITELDKENKPADIVQVQDKLKQMGAPEELAGIDFLREILNVVATSANIKGYAKIVKEKSVLRNMIKVAQKIENECYDCKDEVDNILADAEKDITAVKNSGTSEEITPISDVVIEALDRMDAASKAGKLRELPQGLNILTTKQQDSKTRILFLLRQDHPWVKRHLSLILHSMFLLKIRQQLPYSVWKCQKSSLSTVLSLWNPRLIPKI